MALALVRDMTLRFLRSSENLNLIQPANPLIPMKKPKFIRRLLPASPLLIGAHFATLALLAESIEPLIADAESDAIKAELREIDAQIDSLDEFVEKARTPEEKAAAKARLDILKERFNDLTRDFRQARFDALMGRRESPMKQSNLASGFR